MKKTIISYVAALLVICVCVSSLNATIILSEGFESTTVGALPLVWSSNIPTDTTIGVSTDIAKTGVKSLKFTDNSTAASPTAAYTFTPVVSNTVTVNLDLYSAVNNKDSLYVTMRNSTGQDLGAIRLSGSGTFSYRGTNGAWNNTTLAYSANQWHSLRIDFNITAKTFSAWADDVVIVTDAAFQSNVTTFDASKLVVQSMAGVATGRFTGGAYVDNLLISSVPESTVQPTPSGCYTNSVSFDFVRNSYVFSYQGPNGPITYTYAPGTPANGSLKALSCSVNGSASFLPSVNGGLQMQAGSTVVGPWTLGVSFQLLSATVVNGSTLQAQWRMTYGTSSMTYTYLFRIEGQTLILDVAVQSGTAVSFISDRCENALNPVSIRIPYLRQMNVLHTGGNFCSFFFDWETTNASRIARQETIYSPTSIYFGQNAIYQPLTNGNYNPLQETIYITASTSLVDVLPNNTNPVSAYKNLSAKYIVFDNWEPFSVVQSRLVALQAAGVKNLWVIVHDWQNGGYDNKYPDVIPANPSYGGDSSLQSLSQTARNAGYLFSLHENYVDFYPNGASWDSNDVSLEGNGLAKLSWLNAAGIQSYQMRPEAISKYLSTFASQIHDTYSTTASFHDVCSATDPSLRVDFDASKPNAGKLTEVLARFRGLASLMRCAHNGPVSGEGDNHFLYTGYFDDIEAQINSGGRGPSSQAQWLPLLLDFELRKLHGKALNHGVGYYSRFFADPDNNAQPQAYTKHDVLKYMATELAYGHGGFLPGVSAVYDYVAVAQLEQRHVLSAQLQYVNATPTSILYHDGVDNSEIDVSDYIRRYPTTYGVSTHDNFMGQVRVTYDNGTVVCVNRHPTLPWNVTVGQAGGLFNFNAIVNGVSTQGFTQSSTISYLLPATNGWVVYIPPSRLTIMDNTSATGIAFTPSASSWTVSTSNPGYFGANYLHDGNTLKGSKKVTYTPNLCEGGTYSVYVRWSSDPNRAANVPITVTYAGGNEVSTYNQQINGGQWVLLGSYPFNAGTGGSVTISNTGTTGYVCVDAVLFIQQ